MKNCLRIVEKYKGSAVFTREYTESKILNLQKGFFKEHPCRLCQTETKKKDLAKHQSTLHDSCGEFNNQVKRPSV